MSQTITKSENQSFVFEKITKQQVRRFFQFLMVMGLFSITFIAIRINSPMLAPLLFTEVIGSFIYLIKSSKSNTVTYKN